MSGTSLDGLDIVYSHIYRQNNKWQFEILQTESIDYDKAFQAKLKSTVEMSAEDLWSFHNEFGNWLGEQVAAFVRHNTLEVDFVSSHGHTVFHQPERGFTCQIGSGQHLANVSGLKVICDFRTNDVALGGQGAPLVPIGDRLFFSGYDFCLNLGGISNISFEKDSERIAYDISPANMLLNYLIKPLGKAYDEGGMTARKGSLNKELLQALNSLLYYQLPYPKSLGYEWFREQLIPLLDNFEDTLENRLHTAVYHICEQISNDIKKEVSSKQARLLVTGGGAKNDFLIELLRNNLKGKCEVIVPETTLIDFKEALVFAFMGVLRECGEVNCLKSVTGASRDSSSGVIYYPS
ncbi:anhydro-N-acetylmuramic acid kinase [Leptobacterium flavescens]|uniref:Anhydro-N-acetylmuramic acid kinase n=2 Tax=Leptobacterium flavescens TaxID=472055 RepID=A0A6P0UM43_9FLAO|nr:anhydro-N-acetylmuramic acid kinase [Leptobacterium flavescens]